MLKNWNWKHYFVWIAFGLGFTGAGLTAAQNLPAGSSPITILILVVSMLAMAASKVAAFNMNPPSDPAQAFQQGENALSGAAGAKKNSAGFARLPLLFVLASVCIVFAFLRPGLQRAHRAELSSADVVAVQGEGCAFFQHEAPVLKQDAVVDVPCVLSAVLGGGSLAACGVTSMAQLGGVLGDLIAYYDSQNAPADAGTAGALMVPFKGIPARLTADQLARLKAYAATLADAGAKQ